MKQHWVGFWGSAPAPVSRGFPAEIAKEVTFQCEMTAPVEGSAVRLSFSNRYGTEPVTFGPVRIRSVVGEGGFREVLFRGSSVCTLPAGGELCSDPVELTVAAGETLEVRWYLPGPACLSTGTWVLGPLQKKQFACGGDFTLAPELPLWERNRTDVYFFLCRADLFCAQTCHGVVAFGDSITAQSWPDWLLKAILREGKTGRTVVRRGIGGSRVLREYTNLSLRNYGQKCLDRFVRETRVPGADTVVVLHGINDLIHPGEDVYRPLDQLPSMEELVAGYRQYAAWAHDAGQKIYFCTLMPVRGWKTWDDTREILRLRLNDWLRSWKESDGIVDLDRLAADPRQPDCLRKEFDSGDHLHPSLEGAQQIGEEVFRVLFRN